MAKPTKQKKRGAQFFLLDLIYPVPDVRTKSFLIYRKDMDVEIFL